MIWVTFIAAAALAARGAAEPARHDFYREVRAAGGGRRVFGGEPVSLAVFPAACELVDGSWRTRCSGAVLAPRWALTAAHCVTPSLAHVKYNARSPGHHAAVHSLYRHPEYKVVREDEGRGVDVTLLHHDVGLVRTRADMLLATPPAGDPLLFMRKYNTIDLKSEEVQALGFGRTEHVARGEQLFAARLRLAPCARGSWLRCACAASRARGVCAGDSGGPVLYRGGQVGVTSLGPVRCARAPPDEDASSVFTALYYYVDVLNDTVRGTGGAHTMTRLASGVAPPPAAPLAALLAAAHTTLAAELRPLPGR